MSSRTRPPPRTDSPFPVPHVMLSLSTGDLGTEPLAVSECWRPHIWSDFDYLVLIVMEIPSATCLSRGLENVDSTFNLKTVGSPILSGWNNCRCLAKALLSSFSLIEKKAKVKCVKHPFSNHRTENCFEEIKNCKYCPYNNHHHQMCCVSNVCNTSTKFAFAYDADKVLLKTHLVKDIKLGLEIGVLEDNGSTSNYVTHDMAEKMNLKGNDIKLKIKIATDAILPDHKSCKNLCRKFSVSVSSPTAHGSRAQWDIADNNKMSSSP